jgi:hypothetical protein
VTSRCHVVFPLLVTSYCHVVVPLLVTSYCHVVIPLLVTSRCHVVPLLVTSYCHVVIPLLVTSYCHVVVPLLVTSYCHVVFPLLVTSYCHVAPLLVTSHYHVSCQTPAVLCSNSAVCHAHAHFNHPPNVYTALLWALVASQSVGPLGRGSARPKASSYTQDSRGTHALSGIRSRDHSA